MERKLKIKPPQPAGELPPESGLWLTAEQAAYMTESRQSKRCLDELRGQWASPKVRRFAAKVANLVGADLRVQAVANDEAPGWCEGFRRHLIQIVTDPFRLFGLLLILTTIALAGVALKLTVYNEDGKAFAIASSVASACTGLGNLLYSVS